MNQIEPEISAPSAPADTETTERPQEYVADVSFDELGMSPELRQAVADRGYTNPTPVQAKAFRPVIEGKDLIVRSKTGTGKTAAFGMPLVEKIAKGEREVRALVLCPTRELALQVANELSQLAKNKDLRVAAIYGGASMKEQEDNLSFGSAIVVGTPGRVFDHIRRKNLKLDGCRHAVLDEADEMLNQGFYEDVTRILDYLPDGRQVLLFSATVPQEIQSLISKYTRNAETLLLSGDVFTVEHIHHIRFDVNDAYPKPRNLIYVLEMEEPDNAIIFCNTRDDTELVTAVLNRNGFDAELLNGDLPQKERERVMDKVKRGEVEFMVATDLAARGIDISDLGHVINYSLPEDPAVYLHRVGRTGRIGKKGTAINLVSGRELTTFTTLEKKYNITFEKRLMPSPDEALKMWTERHVREMKDVAAGTVYDGFLQLAGALKGRPDADDLLAFLLKYFFSHHRVEKVQAAKETPPGPSRGERGRDRGERGRERGERGERGRDRGERDRSRRSDRDRGGERRRSEAAAETTAPAESAAKSEGGPVETAGADTGAAPVEGEAGQRGDKRKRRTRERKPAPTQLAEGQARLWMNLGKLDGLDDGSLRTALGAAGAPVDRLVQVDVRGNYSYAIVADGDVAAFEAVSGQHGAKAIKIERARG